MHRYLVLVLGIAVVGASGCCLEATSGRSFDTSSGSSGGASTGGVAGATSSSGSSTGGGTTGFSGPYRGSVEIERLAPEDQPDGGATMLSGRFLMESDVPACDPDTFIFDNGKLACCFQPATASALAPSAGTLSVSQPLEDGGSSTEWISPATGGGYQGPVPPASPWFTALGGTGADVPAFALESLGYFAGPTPVLTPPLSALTSLSTSQDWDVPLTPSEFEYYFRDTAVLEVDGVGSVICSSGDEGILLPALRVPSDLLANLTGHQGTVTVTRDDYHGLLDAGPQLQLGLRLGVRVQSAIGGVSFTP